MTNENKIKRMREVRQRVRTYEKYKTEVEEYRVRMHQAARERGITGYDMHVYADQNVYSFIEGLMAADAKHEQENN